MKKLLSYIISTIIVVGLGVGIFFIVQNIRNSKEYKLTVASGDNGSIVVKIDDNRYTISSTTEESFTVTRKSDITLKAVPNPCYLFSKWDINGSANGPIQMTIKEE